MSETKSEKFDRIASARRDKIAEALRILSSTSNARDYEWTPEDARAIVDPLFQALAELSESYGIAPWVPPAREGAVVASDVAEPESEADDPEADTTPASKARKKKTRMDLVLEAEGLDPRLFAPGEISDLDLVQAGPRIGAAIESLIDEKPQEAKELLLKVMAS